MSTAADSTGYHIRVRYHPWAVIVIHGPTESWQHRPRAKPPVHGYWVGPIRDKGRVEQVAFDLADETGYPIELCKACYHDRQPTPPSVGEKAAKSGRRRKYVPPQADTSRKSRRGV